MVALIRLESTAAAATGNRPRSPSRRPVVRSTTTTDPGRQRATDGLTGHIALQEASRQTPPSPTPASACAPPSGWPTRREWVRQRRRKPAVGVKSRRFPQVPVSPRNEKRRSPQSHRWRPESRDPRPARHQLKSLRGSVRRCPFGNIPSLRKHAGVSLPRWAALTAFRSHPARAFPARPRSPRPGGRSS